MENEMIITGIDIGTTKVVAVIARHYRSQKTENGDSIEILGIGEHPSHGLKKGVVVDIAETTKSLENAIKEAELEADCEIEDVFVGITGDHINCMNYTGKIPINNSSQISGIGSEISVKDRERVLEAAQAINMSPGRRILHTLSQSFEVDDRRGIQNPIGLSGNTLSVNVHLVTSLINVEKDIETCFKKLGIKIKDFVLEPLASSYSVLDQNERNLGVALIDIGGGTTDIVLYHEGGIQHSAAIPLAGQNITLDISHRFKTTLEQGENLKHSYGTAKMELADENKIIDIEGVGGRESRSISQVELCEVIEPRMSEILKLAYDEVKKHSFENKLNFGVVITGGGSQLRDLVDLSQEIFSMPVRIGYPQIIDQDYDTYKDNPRYSTAIGIIQYASKNSFDNNVNSKNGIVGEFIDFFKSGMKKVFKWY